MSERTVYVVNGSKGEYSDRTDWIVGVFETREEAYAWERAATKWVFDAKDWFKENDADSWDYRLESPFDTEDDGWKGYHGKIELGYGATSYWVSETKMGMALPEKSFEPPMIKR